MDTQILTLASLNTMPMEALDMAARQVADRLMALHRALFSSISPIGEYFTPYTFIMTRKELRYYMKVNGYEKYKITEELFPKKKKRGSMRRARMERKWCEFNDSSIIPPISREGFMQKASFSAPWPGPFEGEEEL